MSKMEKQIETMKSDAAYVKAKVEIYVRALQQIAKASEQDNPIALRNRARIALEQEPTTADKINEMNEAIKATPEYQVGKKIFGGDTGIDADHNTVIIEEIDKNVSEVTIIQEARKDIVYGPNDPGDEHHDNEAQLAMDEIKMREDAESAWRDTVLHPEYEQEEE